MFNLLIKKEYRNKFKFTNFLYNELWSLCEKYFDHIDEQSANSTKVVNAMVACYNIVLYCGRTAIDDNTKINIDSFVKNQTKDFIDDERLLPEIESIFYPSHDNSIIIQLFNVTENYLNKLDAEILLSNFMVLKEKTISKFREIEVESVQR